MVAMMKRTIIDTMRELLGVTLFLAKTGHFVSKILSIVKRTSSQVENDPEVNEIHVLIRHTPGI
jgi:hypothetical protein